MRRMAMNDNLLITVNKIGSKPCDGCSTDSISSVKSCKKCVMVKCLLSEFSVLNFGSILVKKMISPVIFDPDHSIKR